MTALKTNIDRRWKNVFTDHISVISIIHN